jgi:signal transduction histidine kinase
VRNDPDSALRSSYPFGLRSTRPVERAVLLVISCAVLTGCAVDLLSATPGAGIAPLALVALGLAMAWRWPYAGLPLVLSAPLVAAWAERSDIVTWSIVAMGVFLLAMRGVRSRYIAPIAAGCAYLGEALTDTESFLSNGALAALAITFAGAVSGSAIREHFRFLHSVEQRAEEAVRMRTAESGRRVTEERLRIARDLHDVVGHQVAVVNMQIGMAEVALPEGADRSRDALHSARAGVQAILKESQRILTVLRVGPSQGVQELEPSPTLRQLGELIASYRAIGLQVESRIGDLPEDLEPGLQTTAYRVLQEALTNAHRHGAGTAVVDVLAQAGSLTVRVTNPVAAAPSSEGSGYGLVGTRERVQSFGGKLEIEQERDEFTLTAILPLHGTETS